MLPTIAHALIMHMMEGRHLSSGAPVKSLGNTERRLHITFASTAASALVKPLL